MDEIRPTVELLHELPDGEAHVDWMLAQDAAGRRPLITYRLPGPVDRLAPGDSLAAERLGDHRPAYLDYEGEVSGGRGRVRRLRRGRVTAWAREAGAWALEIVWEASGERGEERQRLRVEEEAGGGSRVRAIG